VCGLTGFLSLKPTAREDLTATVSAMADTLFTRGPDDSGTWVDEAAGIALGFRRLAILDLSPQGHQPMASKNGRFVIIFNGEIYNFADLRADLESRGHQFTGHSDTEVMLAAFLEFGVEGSVRRFNGMFAFALWDREARALYLCRDRVGKKPMYYGWAGRTFVFGSELKALRRHPDVHPSVDQSAVARYVRFGYVPGPDTIYDGIRKLPPGTLLQLHRATPGELPEPLHYWSAREVADAGLRAPFAGSESEALDALDSLLRDAVKRRMIADVPLGAFLSGGIDSSTIVSLMQAQSSVPVKTFAIGFREDAYNEAAFAAAVARHLGTDHTELYVTPGEALEVIPRLPEIYDEPFADPSQIPTFLVSKLARRSVTVSLSGDGGDELFGGYNRYFWAGRIGNVLRWIPRVARRGAAAVVTAISPDRWGALFSVIPGRVRPSNAGDQIHKVASLFGVRSRAEMYAALTSHWKGAQPVISHPAGISASDEWADVGSFTESMMYLDLVTYLPDDILVKLDRATMAVSLEGRAPFLDHRVVEFAWRLPLAMKVKDGQGKMILRRLLARYVPTSLFERPKMGFGVPIDRWLRGPLKEWAEELLDEKRLQRDGFFNVATIRNRWSEHLSGRRNWQYDLWNILMFQAWMDATRREAAGHPVQTVLERR
jgi:asparagine synthase (glutamine-hydrolysing)